jgi:hypothetical protein
MLGFSIISAIMDETNFMAKYTPKKIERDGKRLGVTDQAETIYAAIKRRMKSRFESKGKLPGVFFIVSSKQTDKDFTARRIRESINDSNVLVRDFSLWNVKADQYSSNKFYVLVGNETVPSCILEPGEETKYKGSLCPENCVLVEVPEDFRRDFEIDLEGCLTGDTKIPLLDGTELPIKDLVGLGEFWTYSYMPDGRFVPGRGHDARLTHKNVEIVKVLLDNGKSVCCTPDHLFMLRSGEYIEARNLSVGDSLMPFYWKRDRHGYERDA